MLAPGTLLGPYKILMAIGAGGMGEVYRAQDTRLQRDVAVKVLTRNLSTDTDALRRFEQEARAAGMLNPPNILAIYDVGYMAPEQVRGGSGDNRSDIFAFGCILYEMLAGAQAFRGESPIETLNAILKDDPPDFLELNVRVPGALDRVVRHCLEKNPDER